MSQRHVHKVLTDVVDSKSRVPVDAEVMDIRGSSIGQPRTQLAQISQAPAKSHCQAGGMKKLQLQRMASKRPSTATVIIVRGIYG